MFSYFSNNKKNQNDILLNIFKEKGIVKIIQDYQKGLEDIDQKLYSDKFQIQKCKKNLNNLKLKIKDHCPRMSFRRKLVFAMENTNKLGKISNESLPNLHFKNTI